MYAILFPNISPIAISLGPVNIYWYSFAYIIGILYGYYLLSKRLPAVGIVVPKSAMENIVLYAVLGIIIGGRLGYVILYHPEYFRHDILMVFKTWEGGMSFHGGVIGLGVAIWLFCHRYKVNFLQFMDQLVCIVPIGLFLGRIANFINQELYGRITDVPWAMIFPITQDGIPRHPSQLYEALLEGLLLYIILDIARKKESLHQRYGVISGIFLCLYSVMRILAECFREPDNHLGYWLKYFTAGQIYSLPLLIGGIGIIFYCWQTKYISSIAK